MTNTYLCCVICLARYGIKGSDLAEKGFKNENDLAEHLENIHGIPVRRPGETKKMAKIRCVQKGIVPDQNQCQCQDCHHKRQNKQ